MNYRPGWSGCHIAAFLRRDMSTTTPPAELPKANSTLHDEAAPPTRSFARRAVLAGSGAALLACAACGSKSAASTAAAAAAPSTKAGPKVAIAAVSDVPAASGLIVQSGDQSLILARANGKVVGHSAACTHQGAIIDGAGVCPLHGSQFNPATGAVLSGPADAPLTAVAVTEINGKVWLA